MERNKRLQQNKKNRLKLEINIIKPLERKIRRIKIKRNKNKNG